jgi:hypothetical protein
LLSAHCWNKGSKIPVTAHPHHLKEGRLNQRAVEVNNQIHQKNGEQLQLRKKIDELKKQLTEPRYENAKKLLLDKVVEKNIITSAIEVIKNKYRI